MAGQYGRESAKSQGLVLSSQRKVRIDFGLFWFVIEVLKLEESLWRRDLCETVLIHWVVAQRSKGLTVNNDKTSIITQIPSTEHWFSRFVHSIAGNSSCLVNTVRCSSVIWFIHVMKLLTNLQEDVSPIMAFLQTYCLCLLWNYSI